jgi:glycosyltransferase involved in cell wall biosynthesis
MQKDQPFVSIVAPAYNEASIIGENLEILCQYMESLGDRYQWELVIVNDGSTDKTGEIAEAFAAKKDNVHILHHFTNYNVGQALKYAFNNCHGDYIVVMDMDLSYSPEHISKLLETIINQKAKIVIASPYMKGGSIANVPWLRKILSKTANKFLSYTSRGSLSTLTGMVRAYDGRFLKSLSLRSTDVSINAEIIYKAMLSRARILEIPATLDWNPKKDPKFERKSSIKIGRSVMAYLLSGFIFRPFIFFIFPGFVFLFLACFSFFWVLVHTFEQFSNSLHPFGSFWIRLSAAVAMAFQQAPHTFIIGGLSLMLSIQLISLGILSLQSKRNFEELFHLGTDVYKLSQEDKGLR